MRSNKNTSKIILATISAILAIVISFSAFSNMNTELREKQRVIDSMQVVNNQNIDNVYAYAIATKNLKAGEMVSDLDVDFKDFPAKNQFAYQNRSDVVNKVLLKDITIGTVFTNDYIANVSNDSLELKDGYRALTLPAENFQGKSAAMTKGSSVDIYSSASESTWTLENIKIMNYEGRKDPVITNASSITFEVPAERIGDFISNISKNKLVLVARKAGDKKTAKKKSSGSSYTNSDAMPNLPATVPISDFPSGSLSGLPQPIKPEPMQQSVELIEANVKSKVTFD